MVRAVGTNYNNGASSTSGSGGSPPNRRGQQSSSKQLTPPSPVRARVRIVPEIYNDYNQIGYKQALSELDSALDERCPVIVIEPINLGDQTTRWIRIGNGLHKTAVLCGSASALGFWIGDPFPDRSARGLWYCLCGTLAVSALASHAIHTVSWQADPCSYYQTETDPGALTRLLADANYYTGGNGHPSSTSGIQSASVVVLVKKDLRGRRYLQNSVAALTIATILYRVYKSWF